MRFCRAIAGATTGLVLATAVGAQRLPGRLLDIVVGDYFFRSPDTVLAGLTTLRVRSTPGDSGHHGAWLVRLGPGHHAQEFIAAERAGAPPPWAVSLGGPGFPAANGDANATMILEAAEYVLLCYVVGPPPARTPHFQLGMFHPFLVVPSHGRAPESIPDPDVEITLTDTAIVLADFVAAGRHVVRVSNHGKSARELKRFRVLPGHTAEESIAWTPRTGTPVPDANASTLVSIPPGGTLTSTWQLRAGTYTLFVLPTAISPRLARALHVKDR